MDQFSNESTLAIIIFINSMFGVRVRCIENAFFTSYHYEGYDIDGQRKINMYNMG